MRELLIGLASVLTVHFFRDALNEDHLVDFIEVLTVEQVSSKVRKVLATAEARERPRRYA